MFSKEGIKNLQVVLILHLLVESVFSFVFSGAVVRQQKEYECEHISEAIQAKQ